MSKLTEAQRAELKSAFDTLDKNKDGVISKEELKGLLKDLSGEDGGVDDSVIDEMMTMADTDKDGMVNFAEFCAAVADGS